MTDADLIRALRRTDLDGLTLHDICTKAADTLEERSGQLERATEERDSFQRVGCAAEARALAAEARADESERARKWIVEASDRYREEIVAPLKARADRLAGAVEVWLGKYTPTDAFGCACTPARTCGTCQWRERTAELRAALGPRA